jgi:hypothetical protein
MKDRLMPRAVSVALLLALGIASGCSRHDNNQVASDLKDAGNSIDRAAVDVAHDPAWKKVGADLHDVGHDMAKDAQATGEKAKGAADDVGAGVKRAGKDVERGSHGQSRDDDRNNAG